MGCMLGYVVSLLYLAQNTSNRNFYSDPNILQDVSLNSWTMHIPKNSLSKRKAL